MVLSLWKCFLDTMITGFGLNVPYYTYYYYLIGLYVKDTSVTKFMKILPLPSEVFI